MRSNPLDAARRSYLNGTRGVIMTVDDSTPVQTVSVRLLPNEMATKVERFQGYGFKSVPVLPDQNGATGAEAMVSFMHGNRSHPIVTADIDRRTQPKNWEQGASGLWHYKGATAKFTTTGWKHDAGPDKQPHTVTVGNAVFTIADGKITGQVGGPGGPAFVVKADAVYLGGDPDQGGTFARVQTESGFSDLAKAKIG